MHKLITKQAFQALLKDDMCIMVGGFMTCGTPEMLIDWIVDSQVQHLTIICNDAGYPNKGVGKLIANHQVARLIASHIGLNPDAGKLMSEKELDIQLVPQGTLAEQIRAYGAGLGGILTPTGLHTVAQDGKQVINIAGTDYLLEKSLGADLAIIQGRQSDQFGNLNYNKTARNFNPVMATAAVKVVAQVETLIDVMDPETVITPHIFVDAIIKEDDHGC